MTNSISAAAIMLLLMAHPAMSTETEVLVDVHGLSKHYGSSKSYNEMNYGAGITVMRGGLGVSAGAYKNSFNRISAYLSGRVMTRRYGNVRAGIEGGIVTGYVSGVSPMIVPVLSLYATDYVVLNMRYLPAIGGITPAVASLSIGIKLK